MHTRNTKVGLEKNSLEHHEQVNTRRQYTWIWSMTVVFLLLTSMLLSYGQYCGYMRHVLITPEWANPIGAMRRMYLFHASNPGSISCL